MPITNNDIFPGELDYVVSDQAMNRWVIVIDRRMDTTIVFSLFGVLLQA